MDRHRRACESFRSCGEAIGEIVPGMSLFCLTRGQWSMIDAIKYCLSQVGKAELSIWTWTVADYEVEVIEGLLIDQRISGALLVIDRSAEQRNGLLIDKWRSRFGSQSVKVCKNHAKISTIQNESFKLLLRGSMNLNWNPRFEQFDLSENDDAYRLVKKVESELPVLRPRCSNLEAENASGVSKSWELSQLKMFRGLRVWNK
jgi:hypothetical protein